jgi:hypothetical protein
MGIDAADIARLGRDAQAQIAAKVAVGAAKEKSKYGNHPTTVNGIKFDSRKEASRYVVLRSMLGDGRIRNLKLQPQYTLQESYVTPDGERIQAIRYVADFSYERPTAPDCTGKVYWIPVVEDVKGNNATKTAQYKVKKKLLAERFGLYISEV